MLKMNMQLSLLIRYCKLQTAMHLATGTHTHHSQSVKNQKKAPLGAFQFLVKFVPALIEKQISDKYSGNYPHKVGY